MEMSLRELQEIVTGMPWSWTLADYAYRIVRGGEA